jgi:hypothetical protein
LTNSVAYFSSKKSHKIYYVDHAIEQDAIRKNDIQHNDTQYNDAHHHDTQYKSMKSIKFAEQLIKTFFAK